VVAVSDFQEFVLVVDRCFCWGFARIDCKNVVLLWSSCGELRGKGGKLTLAFCALKTGHVFQLYFLVGTKEGSRSSPLWVNQLIRTAHEL
jgi:hypothetical protein